MLPEEFAVLGRVPVTHRPLPPASARAQMASQAGSKLSRMAQSFMRDLQGGY